MEYKKFKKFLAACDLDPDKVNFTDAYIAKDDNSFFIPPSFSEIVPSKEKISTIVISSPGAAGKSTLAKQLSFEFKAPIWDLASSRPVGVNSVTGFIYDNFGPNAFKLIKGKDLFIIIDGLDEGKLKTTQENFTAFLEDICKLCINSCSVCFVLLGRIQVAEETWLSLDELDVKSLLISIRFFNPVQSKNFIDKYVQSDREFQKILKQKYQQYSKSRDLILNALKQSLNNEDSQDFIGYPPVLQATATLLMQQRNFAGIQEKFNDLNNEKPIGLLNRIISEILIRESKKVSNNLCKLLKELNIESLYDDEEQVKRLAKMNFGLDLNIDVDMPSNLKSEYEESLTPFLDEHPFIRDSKIFNAVFEAYVIARAMLTLDKDENAHLVNMLRRRNIKPNSLVFGFYNYLQSEGRVNINHVGVLYESLMDSESDSREIWLKIVEIGAGNSEAIVEFSIIKQRNSKVERCSLSYSFDTSFVEDDQIYFRNHLKNSYINISCSIYLEATQKNEYEIGPDVLVICDKLNILSDTLVVNGSKEKMLVQKSKYHSDFGVSLEANKASFNVSRRPKVYGDFQISWADGNSYPWSEYFSPNTQQTEDHDLSDLFRRFRRIALSFRSHSKGQLARYEEKIEASRMLGRDGEAILNQLIQDKIIYKEGVMYVWDQEKAETILKVDYTMLKFNRSSPELREYLLKFI